MIVLFCCLSCWTSQQHARFPSMSAVIVCLFVGCLRSQQHASVSQGLICSDNFTCCHTEIEVADQTFYLTQSQYTDTGPTSPSTDPIIPGAWQGSHWSASFWVTGMTRPRKNPGASGIRTRGLCSRGGRLTTRLTRRSCRLWVGSSARCHPEAEDADQTS